MSTFATALCLSELYGEEDGSIPVTYQVCFVCICQSLQVVVVIFNFSTPHVICIATICDNTTVMFILHILCYIYYVISIMLLGHIYDRVEPS